MALSPMMQEYLQQKEEYKDCLLFYRVGDFYEMFMDDALTASRELEITLTGKDCGLEERAPMCGVPHHAVDAYVDKLVEKGYHVAICDQVEDPKFAKGLVKREVVRVVTPGTNMSDSSLSNDKNRYITCIFAMEDNYGVSSCDLLVGKFMVTECRGKNALLDEISRIEPSEIIGNASLFVGDIPSDVELKIGAKMHELPASYFNDKNAEESICKQFSVANTDGAGLTGFPVGKNAAGALISYLFDTQKSALPQITEINTYVAGQYMMIDSATMRNLELIETIREKKKSGALFGVLDKTKTAMGARMLRSYIERPLRDTELIDRRLDIIEALIGNEIELDKLRKKLDPVYDLERLVGRIALRTAGPKELISLYISLSCLPEIHEIIGGIDCTGLRDISEVFDNLTDIASLIYSSINDDPPVGLRDGDIIKDGYSDEVDELRRAKVEGTKWLADLEAKEREETGISTLKIKLNRVFGYCIEVTNSFKDKVPERYQRRQTLTNAERYITPELKELEDKVLGAQDKLNNLEYSLFTDIREKIAYEIPRLKETASHIATIDAIASLAECARRYRYVRPGISDDGVIDIKGGRHPVVEHMCGKEGFISNDTYLDLADERIAVITGPNMAGKSTYMRQVALITLMAHMGSYVPAISANIGLVDRIFTRVGASDDLATGQSTFMVEMTEVSSILRNATSKSLLILDEIGRGTSTYDGLSIAQAVIEYVSGDKIGAKTLFATHYHELTELEGVVDGVRNYCVAVKENGEEIVFLRKIVRGGADRSYGIEVARLAGVPSEVLKRAKVLSDAYTGGNEDFVIKKNDGQITLFDFNIEKEKSKALEMLDELSVDTITPIEALNILHDMKNKRLDEI